MAKNIKIIIVAKLLLLFSYSASSIADSQVRVFEASTLFSLTKEIHDVPQHSENWNDAESTKAISKEELEISYPEQPNPNNLILKKVNKGNYALKLAKRTSIRLANQPADYLGFVYHNGSHKPEDIELVVTMEDGTSKRHIAKSVGLQGVKFSGIIAEDNRRSSIQSVDLITQPNSNVHVDGVQWGRLSASKSGDVAEEKVIKLKSTVKKVEPKKVLPKKIKIDRQVQVPPRKLLPGESCDMTPELVSVQCDGEQWLFDIRIVGNSKETNKGWWCSNNQEDIDNKYPEDDKCASFGETASYGYFSKQLDQQKNIIFTDQNDSRCSRKVTVDLPKSCQAVKYADCTFSYTEGVISKSCVKNGSIMPKEVLDKEIATVSPLIIHPSVNLANVYNNNPAQKEQSEVVVQTPQRHLPNKVGRPVISPPPKWR